MALELQNAVIAAVRAALPEHDIIEEPATPPWLNRPGRAECGAAWPLVSDLYRELTGLELPEQMPPRERRHLDAVLSAPAAPPGSSRSTRCSTSIPSGPASWRPTRRPSSRLSPGR